jgi:RHS repeat-associated protein
MDANDLALFADRGFTGHEYLSYFNLYNMNGRLYDPLVGRFLNVDNNIQNPTFTQNYNRYSYCLNNPLKYTDLSGNNTYKQYMDDTYGEGNYWYRGQAPGTWGGGSGSSGGGGGSAGGSYGGSTNYGRPGQSQNGTGVNGIYYDWYSGTYRSTDYGNSEVGWGYSYNTISSHGDTWQRVDAYVGSGDVLAYKGTIWKYVPGSETMPAGQGDGFLDKGLDYAGKTNDAVDAFAKTLGTNGLTAVMVSGGKTIVRYSGPAGIVISTGQVFNGVRKDGYTYGYNAQKATAGAVGGMAGAWAGFQAGAWAGFEAGFTIGLAFEGVGAIPGAVIGGIVGGFGGAWGGAYGGSKLGESLISNKAQ